MRTLLAGFLLALAAVSALVAVTQMNATGDAQDVANDRGWTDSTPIVNPVECKAGCGDARHPTKILSVKEFHRLVAEYESEPRTGGKALDALCYYGGQTLGFMDSEEFTLDVSKRALLKHELQKDQALLSVRLIDADGNVCLSMLEHRVPLGERNHLHVDSTTIATPPIISGTVKRVGLHHIWARF